MHTDNILVKLLLLVIAIMLISSCTLQSRVTEISLPIDSPQEAIQIVKNNRELIESDLADNGKEMNTLEVKSDNALFGRAYSVLVYKSGAPRFFGLVSSMCPAYIHAYVEKDSGEIKYLFFRGCTATNESCKNFKCVELGSEEFEEGKNLTLCESLTLTKNRDSCFLNYNYYKLINERDSLNISLCENIESAKLRQECISDITKYS